jgi:acetate kinase
VGSHPGLIPEVPGGQLGWSVDAIDNALNQGSGLKGLTGHRDFREVLARCAQGDEAARLGFDIYAYRISKFVGAYAAVLG